MIQIGTLVRLVDTFGDIEEGETFHIVQCWFDTDESGEWLYSLVDADGDQFNDFLRSDFEVIE